MNHFFVLGNHPDLSTAELTACFNFKKIAILGEVLIGQVALDDPAKTISQLGGTIKIGRLVKKVTKSQIYETALAELNLAPKNGKFNFGLSLYGRSNINVQKIGLELKSALKNSRPGGTSCRFVTSREKQLSSVVVAQNKLISSGRELVFIAENNGLWLGITEAVQPFKDLSRRDYGRPKRDDYSGMLPPKLAQIMINLARAPKEEIILDPFCGSGTILTEALLLGFKKLAGSDISQRAISDTKENMEWIAKRYNLTYDLRLSVLNALKLSQNYQANSSGAIISETYLGPQRGKVDYKKTAAELKIFYNKVLEEIFKILKPRGRAILALPVFLNGHIKINPTLPSGFIKKDSFIYGRPGQRVFREIIVLEKR